MATLIKLDDLTLSLIFAKLSIQEMWTSGRVCARLNVARQNAAQVRRELALMIGSDAKGYIDDTVFQIPERRLLVDENGDAMFSENDEQNGPNSDKILVENIRPLFENCTLDIVKGTSLGVENDSALNDSYRKALKSAINCAFNRQINPLNWADCLFAMSKVGKQFYANIEILQNYSNKIIKERIKYFRDKLNNNNNIEKFESLPIFIDILLGNFCQSNEQEVKSRIQSEVNTFIVTGHDTTAMALTFTILLVGRHWTIQNKIYSELVRVFCGNMQKEIELDDLREMGYLEQCIKETLRMYPSAEVIGRKLTVPLTLPWSDSPGQQ